MPRRPSAKPSSSVPWWQRSGLEYVDGVLQVGGVPVTELARTHHTPLYVYDGERIRQNLHRLQSALDAVGLSHRVLYAMKSNRHLDLLRGLRRAGVGGIDTCSPAEVRRARRAGFKSTDISYTGTSLSDLDLAELMRHPDLVLNCDSLHDIERVAALAPGRRIGLRINPGLGIGYRRNRLLRYAGGGGTKFGIHREQFATALRRARQAGLVIEGLHVHSGCGYLTPQLPVLDRIFQACEPFVAKLPHLRYLNIGGGLGIPLTADDRALDLDAWAKLVRQHWAGAADEIWCEPGDYLSKDAGVLVLEVNTVETKGRTLYAGTNGGFSLHPEPAFYSLPLHPVTCIQPSARTPLRPVTLVGNINEALDVLHAGIPFPPLRNGDLVAFLNAGGYGAAMASNHCLRGEFSEVLLPPRAR